LVINLDSAIVNLIIQIIVNIVIIAPVLWISGRLFAGKDKAKFTDALWIVVLGTVIGGIFSYFFSGIVATIIVLFIWLALVKNFFDTEWIKALIISVVAIIIWIIIAIILGVLLGIGLAILGIV
jgi:hypothetical protein